MIIRALHRIAFSDSSMSTEPAQPESTLQSKKTKNVGAKGKKHVSKSTRAGLVFPVGRVLRYMRKNRLAKRVGVTSAVFMAAALERITAELAEISGNAARDNHKQRISSRFLTIATTDDEEFRNLFGNSVVMNSGVAPIVNMDLIPKTKEEKASKKRHHKALMKEKRNVSRMQHEDEDDEFTSSSEPEKGEEEEEEEEKPTPKKEKKKKMKSKSKNKKKRN